jgi:hypothetical protein
MKNPKIKIIFTGILLVLASVTAAQAQHPTQNKTDSRMVYHYGPVMKGASHVYFIYYGCWSCGMQGAGSETQTVLGNLVGTLGLSPYFRINSTYPDSTGVGPSGALVYAGAVTDETYSQGNELTAADVAAIPANRFTAGELPVDPAGIYLIIATPDVSSVGTGFCNAGFTPFHGESAFMGAVYRYIFIGNAMRCPAVAGPQFVASDESFLPTPNGDFAGDVMASMTARALNMTVTNPAGDAWYDRYFLENAEKCQRTFGTTYTTANGARANIHLGARDYLLDQNWVNDRKGYCSVSYP